MQNVPVVADLTRPARVARIIRFARIGIPKVNPVTLAAFVTSCALTVALLCLSGAFKHELGGSPDEAAHFVTGLMIHDYVQSGARVPPMEFAKQYYAHYPKVAFGIWPPLFHVAEGAWMVLFSPSKASVMLMLGLITATLAFLVFRVVERRFGFASGVAAGLFFVTMPLTQRSTGLVMADSTVALFSFLAILRFAEYLDTERLQDAALFGIWSSAAILTKYNGLALAFVPVICIASTGRWRLLFRWRTWLPAGIVIIFCGPWYLLMWKMVTYAAEPTSTLSTVLPTMKANLGAIVAEVGAPVAIVALIGIIYRLYAARRGGRSDAGIWPATISVVFAFWLFHSVVTPFPDPRYLLPVIPSLILLLIAGMDVILARVRLNSAPVAGVMLLLYVAATFQIYRTPRHGYAEVAAAVSRSSGPDRGAILVDGSSVAEGMMVSEVAIRDRDHRIYVFRGTKLLATSTWMGDRYRANYDSPEAVGDALDRAGISTVVLANDVEPGAHHRLLGQILESRTDTWRRWAAPEWRGAEYFTVYRRMRSATVPGCVSISMKYTLGGDLDICPSAQAGEVAPGSSGSP